MSDTTSHFDVFISYASEDRDVAQPIAEALRFRGFDVWFDDHTLSAGDDLRRSLLGGLRAARFGVVILSPNFFAKEWPRTELFSLWVRESLHRRTVLLPVLHNMTMSEVADIDPVIAKRVALPSSRGIPFLVSSIANVLETDDASASYTAMVPVDRDEGYLQTLIRSLQGLPLRAARLDRVLASLVATIKVALPCALSIVVVMQSAVLMVVFCGAWALLDHGRFVLHRAAQSPIRLIALFLLLITLGWAMAKLTQVTLRRNTFQFAMCFAPTGSAIAVVLWVATAVWLLPGGPLASRILPVLFVSTSCALAVVLLLVIVVIYVARKLELDVLVRVADSNQT